MIIQIDCPVCSCPLYLPQDINGDSLEVLCQTCYSKYSAVYAKVFESTSPSITSFFGLIFKTNSGKLDFIKLIKKKCLHKTFLEIPDDDLLLLYGVHKQRQRKKLLIDWLGSFIPTIEQKISLLAIVKRRSGSVYSLPSVLKMSSVLLLLVYAAGISAFSLVLFPAAPFSLGSVLISAIPVTLALNCAISYSKRTFKEREKSVITRLFFEQQQLSQIAELETRTYQLRREIEISHKTVGQLQTLHQSMVSLAPEVYAKRCELVGRAINVLLAEIDNISRLIDSYSYLTQMLSIEYKLSRLLEQFPKNTSSDILLRLEEIKLLESKKEELALQINPAIVSS